MQSTRVFMSTSDRAQAGSPGCDIALPPPNHYSVNPSDQTRHAGLPIAAAGFVVKSGAFLFFNQKQELLDYSSLLDRDELVSFANFKFQLWEDILLGSSG